MIDTRKEQERAALHSTIWRIANDMRGSVDGWDFKQYVLVLLFYRFISENLSCYVNEKQKEAGEKNFNYAALSDKDAERARDLILEEKGFFIHPSELFENVRKRAASDDNLNETLETVFKNIEASAQGTDSESDMKGLFDDIDVNSNKLGATVVRRNEKLVKLLNAIGDLPIGNYDDNSIDLFGDAYEYLMTMYAANAGKSGGEFSRRKKYPSFWHALPLSAKRKSIKFMTPLAVPARCSLNLQKCWVRKISVTDSLVRKSTSRPTIFAASTCSCTI